jgi:BASS family bile acid:Na+ symporter
VANAILQLVGFGLFKTIGWKDALTLGFAGGNRNMGLILAVLPATADPDITLYFALAQFPMYVYPALLKPLVRKWSDPH